MFVQLEALEKLGLDGFCLVGGKKIIKRATQRADLWLKKTENKIVEDFWTFLGKYPNINSLISEVITVIIVIYKVSQVFVILRISFETFGIKRVKC